VRSGTRGWASPGAQPPLAVPPPTSGTGSRCCPPVGRDQSFLGIGVSLGTHLLPPPADGLPRELRRPVIDAHAHPTLVLAQIDHPGGNDFAQLQVREVVPVHLFGLALGRPLAPTVLERAYQFLLLRVHRDPRLTAWLKPRDHHVDVLELRIAIRMRGPFFGRAVALHAIAGSPQQRAHCPRADGVCLPRQFLRQTGGALAGADTCVRLLSCAGEPPRPPEGSSCALPPRPRPCGSCCVTCRSPRSRHSGRSSQRFRLPSRPSAGASVHPSTGQANGIVM
jgi:hypothetical protein